MSSTFAGKVAVVTGVTSGIGASLLDRLILEGARVLGIARDREKLVAIEERFPGQFTAFVADLSLPSARDRCFAELLEAAPSVDFLVNNAAECVYDAPLSLSVARWRHLFEVNVLAAIELTRAVAPRMKDGGHVFNTSSVTARFVPNARFAPYAMTKATLESYHHALRLELDPRGVKVTLIVPGLVDTPIYDKVPDFEKTRGKIKEQVPSWLRAEDVADASVWIASRPDHVVVSELVMLPRGQAR
ncbi:MAG: SDR family NAD(P)-dependent oxidoreductase [Polyangiales bacterium]